MSEPLSEERLQEIRKRADSDPYPGRTADIFCLLGEVARLKEENADWRKEHIRVCGDVIRFSEENERLLGRYAEIVLRKPEAGREALAQFMTVRGFATGHGDTIESLLEEFGWQLEERHVSPREPVPSPSGAASPSATAPENRKD